MKKKLIFVGIAVLGVVLVACSLPGQPEDPFAAPDSVPRETVVGEILPFGVAVSTRATHRLEHDNKLVVLLASDVANLDDFVHQEVSVTGLRQTEKMREIFWVEEVHLLDEMMAEDELTEKRFVTKTFTFVYPTEWQQSTSPDGIAHFTARDDEQGRVFLKFSVEPITRRDKRIDLNVSIGDFQGTKNVAAELGKEQQTITLYSNEYDKKYTFAFVGDFEEFDKKKAFYRLLNSFVEGEVAVSLAQQEDLRVQAEREAKKVRELTKPVEPEVVDEVAAEEATEDTDEKEGGLFSKLFKKSDEKSEINSTDALEKVAATEADGVPKPLKDDFTNLIDGRAYPYSSGYYGFQMRVPYGHWFWNFGQVEPFLAQIAVATHKIETPADGEFFLEIVPSESPVTEAGEFKNRDGEIVIEWPRNVSSYFRLHGPESFRDAMRSVQSTVAGYSE